jgi:electron transfer flavoprotein alpha subunit
MSIIVFTEHIEGKLKKQSAELVSYAAQMAEKNSLKVVAVAIGSISADEVKSLSEFGASKIIHAPAKELDILDNQVYTHILSEIFTREQGKIMVLGNSFTGKAIAPRLSVRLKAGLVAGVMDLPRSFEPFEVKKKIFNGKAFAYEQIKTSHKILTLNANACDVLEKPTEAEYEEYAPQGLKSYSGAEVVDISRIAADNPLTEASIVVSGGRGMKSGDNWAPLEELAGLLNAATACSKPVSDEGWRPHEEHVGQTGKTIAPDLYVAVGISGAVQHLAGVSSSKTIVAINTDKEAPIFQIADYGIIADAREVLPKLIQSVSKLGGS